MTTPTATRMAPGAALCLASGAAFGAMGVFGKLAYAEGATVGTLLAVRFTVAAALFWMLVAATRPARPARRDALAGLGLGAIGYALQAGCYFAALRRIDAGLLSLLLYTFPAIVAVAAVLLGRERMTARKAGSLALSSAGLALVVGGTGALDTAGAALGLTAALVYSTYILVGDGLAGRVDPRALAALVCTGAAVTLTITTAAIGDLHPAQLTPAGWGWIAALAAISTVAAMTLFFAGLQCAGPTTASILSTVEPVTTLLLAFLVFGDTLGIVQTLGGALVLSAVVTLARRMG